jgi:hypothetical protein
MLIRSPESGGTHVEHITDPVFGALEFDGHGWSGKVLVEAFNQDLELYFLGDPTQLNRGPYQRTLNDFLVQQHQLKTALERAIFDYYMTNLEDHRMPYSVEEEETFVPTLHNPSEIWSQVRPFLMALDCKNPERCSLTIEFRANWDEEHGMDVMFFDGKIGVAAAGDNWSHHTHYDLEGARLT